MLSNVLIAVNKDNIGETNLKTLTSTFVALYSYGAIDLKLAMEGLMQMLLMEMKFIAKILRLREWNLVMLRFWVLFLKSEPFFISIANLFLVTSS